MIRRLQEKYETVPEKVAMDGGFASKKNLKELKRSFCMNKCPWRSFSSFKSNVWSGIFAANLITICKLMLQNIQEACKVLSSEALKGILHPSNLTAPEPGNQPGGL